MKLIRTVYVVWIAILFAGFFLVTYPFLLLFLSHPKFYRAAHIYRKVWGWFICIFSGIIPVVTGEEKLSRNKVYIYCPNHSSYLDIITMSIAMPGFFIFMAKNELAKIPLFGIWFRTIDIGVERQSITNSYKAFSTAKKRLEAGQSLCLFPEGTIHKTAPKLSKFKDGAFRLAIENGVSIVPVSILDNYKRLPEGNMRMSSPGRMRVHVHRPISTTHLKVTDVDELKAKVFAIIENKLIDENVNSRNI